MALPLRRPHWFVHGTLFRHVLRSRRHILLQQMYNPFAPPPVLTIGLSMAQFSRHALRQLLRAVVLQLRAHGVHHARERSHHASRVRAPDRWMAGRTDRPIDAPTTSPNRRTHPTTHPTTDRASNARRTEPPTCQTQRTTPRPHRSMALCSGQTDRPTDEPTN